MELVPHEPRPRALQFLVRVRLAAQPRGQRRGALGRGGQRLVAAVPPLHHGLRRVAAGAVAGHHQLAVVARQARDLRRRQLAEQLVGRGRHHLRGPARGQALLQHLHRRLLRRAAHVAGAVVLHGHGRPAGGRRAPERRDDGRVAAHVGHQVVVVGARVQGGRHLGAAHAAPHADVERHAVGRAPGQLLAREPGQPAVAHHRGQGVAEPEAVGQEHVHAALPQLAVEPAVAVQHVSHQRLGRGHVGVDGVHPRAAHVPAARARVLLQAGVLGRVVFLHQLVAERALEAEHVVRVLLQQAEVVVERVAQVLVDGRLDRPAPLGVQMRGRDDVHLPGGSGPVPRRGPCTRRGRGGRRRRRQDHGHRQHQLAHALYLRRSLSSSTAPRMTRPSTTFCV